MAHQLRTLVPLVQLPNGVRIEAANTTVTVSDDVWALIPASAVGTIMTDLGAVQAGDAVTVQAAHVGAVGALTSSQAGALTSSQNATAAATDLTTSEALANALKANYNQLQTDVAALRASYNQLQTDVATVRTALNAEIAAMEVTQGPQA
jgi:uncharacterized protein YlxW (UPF0749 family)